MAVSNPTTVAPAKASSSVVSVTSASFTPTGGALLVVTGVANSASAPTVTDSAGLTWTTFQRASTNLSLSLFIATAPASPAAMTVTVSRAGSANLIAEFYQVTGQAGIGGNGNNSSAGSPLTVTLPAAPASSSLLVGALGVLKSTLTPTLGAPTGWTASTTQSVLSDFEQFSYRNGSGATSNNFTATNGPGVLLGVVVEIHAAIAAALADTIPVSDSLTETIGALRVALDTIAVSDSLAAVAVEPRALADTIGFSDSLAITTPRAVTDTIPVTDSLTTASGVDVTPADSIPVTDSLPSGLTFPRALADLIPVSDSTLTRLTLDRAFADLIAITDSLEWTVPASPTPASRIYRVGAETRTLRVGAEVRVRLVAAENRTEKVG